MAQNTYGRISEEILTQYYKQTARDNSGYTLRHIAEMICQEQAYFAKGDALEQDRLGESVYANDQFITTYNGLSLLTDVNGVHYVPMPNTAAGLPQGRELAYIAFTGIKKWQIFPMRNKDVFMQNFAKTPSWMILAYEEGGLIKLDNVPVLLDPTTAKIDLKLVGSVPSGAAILDLPLNLPKSTEILIVDKVLARMNSERNIEPQPNNDNFNK